MASTHLSVKSLIFLFSFLVVFLTSCDLLEGEVISSPKSEPVYSRCSDQAGFMIRDYCLNETSREFKFLIENVMFSSIDSVRVTVFGEENYQEDVDLDLEPTYRKVKKIVYPDIIKHPQTFEFRGQYIGTSGMLASCIRLEIPYEQVRTCGK
jgi:hypothetical protein